MPRAARKKSSTGIYHVILRGINRQNIFEDDEDRNKILQTITVCKQKSGFELYGYCLMSNHIHLLIREGKEDLGLIFRRIGASFVQWYNWKYKRSGHLFQDRYKSEAIEDDAYFLTVLRYIHHNPIKANMASHPQSYPWSSCSEYVEGEKYCNVDFSLALFSENQNQAVEGFLRFHAEQSEDHCLDISESDFRLTDDEAKAIMRKVCKVDTVSEFQRFEVALRDKYLKELLDEGISTRQMARLTGVGRSIILRLNS